MSRPDPDQGLGRHQRLTRSSDIEAAFECGRKFVGKRMVLFVLDRPEGRLRLGVVAGKKVGGAVQRNRARRLLREVYRRNRYRLSGCADVVLVARSDLLVAPWSDLEAELMELARQAGLVATDRADNPMMKEVPPAPPQMPEANPQ